MAATMVSMVGAELTSLGGAGPSALRGACYVLDVPKGVRLAEVEALLLPLCSQGPILAIGRLDGRILVEFDAEDDASACVGQHMLRGAAVTIELGEPVDPADVDFAGAYADSSGFKGESKKDKERRLNRVGLSYRCGRCGQPKKGHVCMLGDEGEGDPVSATVTLPTGRLTPPPPSSAAGWDLESESIFKEMKHVLHPPTPVSNQELTAATAGALAGDVDAAPTDMRKSERNSARHARSERERRESTGKRRASALDDDLNVSVHRPPSLIIPEEAAEGRHSQAGQGPATHLSIGSDMFSPNVLINHLLGTPVAQQQSAQVHMGHSPGSISITALSPGALDHLLLSPAPLSAINGRTPAGFPASDS